MSERQLTTSRHVFLSTFKPLTESMALFVKCNDSSHFFPTSIVTVLEKDPHLYTCIWEYPYLNFLQSTFHIMTRAVFTKRKRISVCIFLCIKSMALLGTMSAFRLVPFTPLSFFIYFIPVGIQLPSLPQIP